MDTVSSQAQWSDFRLVRWMFSFLRPVRGKMIFSCIYLTLWIVVEILAVRQTAEAVNQIKEVQFSDGAPIQTLWNWLSESSEGSNPDHPASGLRRIVLVLAGLCTALAVLTYLREVSSTKLTMAMVFHMREAVYDKLQRVGFAFHDRVSTGELINRALSDLQNVRQFLNSAVLLTLEIVLIVGGYIALLATRSVWVALLSLAPIPFWLIYLRKFSRTVQPVQQEVMEAGDRNVDLITENIAGIQVVKAFATEPLEIEKYDRHSEVYRERVMRRIRLFANFTPIVRSIAVASHLTLFLAAGILILRGRLNPGDVLMLGSAMGAILSRLQQVSTINEHYQSAIVSARRIHEVLNAAATVPSMEAAKVKALPNGPGVITFENVTFGYDPDSPVLHDVTFEIPGGRVAAIVGPTGSGKSTLVSLIARFYDPQQGRILLDGDDIRGLPLEELRQAVSIVFQETYLFSDTVTANVGYGKPGRASPEIENAARIAQALEFVEELPKRFDTLLGERGITLSGGQRQRLAIARSILTDPRVLILDDATASVDPQTEALIQEGMRSVMGSRTTFIIAHRLSTVKGADVVIVLEKGRVTQVGRHGDLMAQEGHYREMAEAQLAANTDSDVRVLHDDQDGQQASVAGDSP